LISIIFNRSPARDPFAIAERCNSVSQKFTPGVCIIVGNEAVPFDRRAWLEARSLVDAGFNVSVICPAAGDDRVSHEILEGVEIYRYRALKAKRKLGHVFKHAWALICQFYLALRVFSKTRFQVLQGCNPPDTVFLIALFFKPFGVRYVFDHHELAPELYSLHFRSEGLLYRLVRRFERLSFQTADLCIATNDSFRDVAIEHGGVPRERILVVQTCAELHELKETLPSPDLKSGFRYMVVYAGRMEIQDGMDLLLSSIKHIVKDWGRADVLFALLGDGTELPQLRAMADSWGLGANVRFIGRVAHSEVCSYLATANVCVAPDPMNPLNDNSSMVKIFEYMGFGKPIVLYDLKEGRRTADGAALFACPNDPFDFAQQIVKLLDQPSLRDDLGKRGRKRVFQRLNWETEQRKLIAAYHLLCGVEEIAIVEEYEEPAAPQATARYNEESSLRHT
jgi:glycosyltransferase involved in cell wall biosynthesis